MSIAIWAPHGDDEIIGCYGVLTREKDVSVYFGQLTGDLGIPRSAAMFGFSYDLLWEDRGHWDVVYAPDPAADPHPLHQTIGQRAQQMFRAGKIRRLIHYTTSMQAPYIFETGDPDGKRHALDRCYFEKLSLWQYDHRYWLFEGRVEWHRP